jgi:hypothetical protein
MGSSGVGGVACLYQAIIAMVQGHRDRRSPAVVPIVIDVRL